MGWNTLRIVNGGELLRDLDGADVYFAHSFACQPADRSGLVSAETEHDGCPSSPRSSETGLAGVQFHPERSGAAGSRLLQSVLAWSRSA